MLVYEKTSVYLAIELSLREIYYVLYVRALMKQKSCVVGMRNAKQGNHLKCSVMAFIKIEIKTFLNTT